MADESGLGLRALVLIGFWGPALGRGLVRTFPGRVGPVTPFFRVRLRLTSLSLAQFPQRGGESNRELPGALSSDPVSAQTAVWLLEEVQQPVGTAASLGRGTWLGRECAFSECLLCALSLGVLFPGTSPGERVPFPSQPRKEGHWQWAFGVAGSKWQAVGDRILWKRVSEMANLLSGGGLGARHPQTLQGLQTHLFNGRPA